MYSLSSGTAIQPLHLCVAYKGAVEIKNHEVLG